MVHGDGLPQHEQGSSAGDMPVAHEVEALAGESNPEILPRSEPWRKILQAIGLAEQVVGAILLFVILVLVVALVAQRYVPGANYPWTGEVARLSMVWATFIIAGYLAAHDRQIAIHVVDFALGARALAAIKLFANVVVLVTCVGLAYAVILLIGEDIGQVTPAAEIPLRIVNAIPITGFVLTAVRMAVAIVAIDLPAVRGQREEAA